MLCGQTLPDTPDARTDQNSDKFSVYFYLGGVAAETTLFFSLLLYHANQRNVVKHFLPHPKPVKIKTVINLVSIV